MKKMFIARVLYFGALSLLCAWMAFQTLETLRGFQAGFLVFERMEVRNRRLVIRILEHGHKPSPSFPQKTVIFYTPCSAS